MKLINRDNIFLDSQNLFSTFLRGFSHHPDVIFARVSFTSRDVTDMKSIFQALLAKNLHPQDEKDVKDGTIIHFLLTFLDTPRVPELLELIDFFAEYIDVNAQDIEARTALHYLCNLRIDCLDPAVHVIRKLLDKGADPLLADANGLTAVDVVDSYKRKIVEHPSAPDRYVSYHSALIHYDEFIDTRLTIIADMMNEAIYAKFFSELPFVEVDATGLAGGLAADL
jgi:hypothetical protein